MRKNKKINITTSGEVVQITLPCGKYAYTAINSIIHIIAKQQGLSTEIVKYYGECDGSNICDRAFDNKYLVIIDEVDSIYLREKIANKEEIEKYLSKLK